MTKEKIFPVRTKARQESEPISVNGVTYIGDPEFTVVDYTDEVHRKEEAYVKLIADVDTEISIFVYYKSGLSSSKSLIPKTPLESGIVEWTWEISANTAHQLCRVVIQSDNSTAVLYISIR
jgi:hypothetical protein